MSSPPVSEGYPTNRSHGRSESDDLSEDHKYKRRRLEEQPSPVRNMTDPSRPPSFPAPPPTLHYTPFYSHATDNFPFLPAPLPMNSGVFWEEDAALEYLASGNGFAQDLRGLVPTLALPYSFPTAPSASQPHSRPSEVTSHPVYQHPRLPPALPSHHRGLPDDLFQRCPAGISDERLREVAGRVSESTRFLVDSQFGSSASLSHQEDGHPHPPSLSTNEFPPSRRSPPTASIPVKPAIVLTLSRATSESIGALEEHKRECPACQLEFESDNFMAVITCCDTAMHASCLSAWVNSQTYAKSKTCMKCRRLIDARRPLNNVVPPVNEKTWDEGGSFDAPEHLKGDAKIELDVSPRPSRPTFRRYRGSGSYTTTYSRGSTIMLPATVSSETHRAITRARQDQISEIDDMKRRLRAACSEQTRAHDENLHALGRLLEAQKAASRGNQVDLVSLDLVRNEKQRAKNKAAEKFQRLKVEMSTIQRAHAEQMNALVEEAFREQHRTRVAEGEPGRSLHPSTEGIGAQSTMFKSP
ncbi:hypothetical protein A1O3_07603 [Capronia epimyces CBS 606.96]|uniref:RING-type domain-containing protein n=1 Tax=Capronia epimyces CBS 606.96 TaxID=1182542 RepID=W9XM70_9EURO|nr:uncharacterized protein A1O3_07603 [Capronia epimyces CBS 606.96]EXJ81313.1 hypothetical protein A1O3_07603 [Capronia epimyces CBS 606.96]